MSDLQFKLLSGEAWTPQRTRAGDAGFDLYADAGGFLAPGVVVGIPTGVAVALPEGCAGCVWPRSGLASKGIGVLGGLIDPNYRGEIKVLLINHSGRAEVVEKGDRIAQLLVTPFYTGDVETVDELPDTERGAAGFGSSGR